MTNRVINTTTAFQAAPADMLTECMVTGAASAVERQESMGQVQLVMSDVLPRRIIGAERSDFERLGFVFGAPVEGDPLFVHATLPAGWMKRATTHPMTSEIVDEKGRRRVHIFYKAAFYDRDANMSLEAPVIHTVRCSIQELPNGGWRVTWGLGEARMSETKTAAAALKRARRVSARMAQAGRANAVVITWEPCSNVGRAVVAALQTGDERRS